MIGARAGGGPPGPPRGLRRRPGPAGEPLALKESLTTRLVTLFQTLNTQLIDYQP